MAACDSNVMSNHQFTDDNDLLSCACRALKLSRALCRFSMISLAGLSGAERAFSLAWVQGLEPWAFGFGDRKNL